MGRDGAEATSSGKLFQILAPAIGNVRRIRKDGTSSWLDDEDRSLRRLGMSATRVNWDVPCKERNVSMATLKTIRSGTRSQWRLNSASVMCSDCLLLMISLAAAFWTDCSRRMRLAGKLSADCYNNRAGLVQVRRPVAETRWLCHLCTRGSTMAIFC